ncbi:hypothetical protein PR202_gb02743 [Eleusine coracana subsp. coracana]|uniref:Uncharacterized protein n=1 Tax=Eleusine coracana subsp. coracana TaxID=191504 RepID=A0AAV5E001_ELECO|nr:hypothetical protein PR202_gb02743 [Eleusine coracana subsp. coracana]
MSPDWVAEHLTRLAVENADAVTGVHLTLTPDDRDLAELKTFSSVLIVLAEVDAWSDTGERSEICVALQAAHSRRRGLLDFDSRRRLAMATLPELDAA